jgi:hypothetical protein
MSVHRRRMGPVNGGLHPQDLLSFYHRKYAIAKKNEGKIE